MGGGEGVRHCDLGLHGLAIELEVIESLVLVYSMVHLVGDIALSLPRSLSFFFSSPFHHGNKDAPVTNFMIITLINTFNAQ